MDKSTTKDANHIKVGASTRVRNAISYAMMLFKEKNMTEINISAIGGAIGSLVNIAEVVKTDVAGLYQTNKISTVSYQTVDSSGKVINERLYPKMEIILSTEAPKTSSEGSQGKMDEEERKKLLDYVTERKAKREQEGGEFRGGRGRGRGDRGFGRGRGRGDRGFGRGGRGGRGSYGGERGGSSYGRGRGSYGGEREGSSYGRGRGSYGGERSGYQGESSRGGYSNRGGEGQSRGGRGTFRGRGDGQRGDRRPRGQRRF